MNVLGLVILIAWLLSWSPLASAQAPPPTLSKLELDWESVVGADYYELEFTFSAENEKPKTYRSKTPNFSEEMLAGTYKFRIRSVTKEEGPGQWSAPVDLVVLPLEVVPLEPPDKSVVVASGHKQKQKVNFKWQPAQDAKGYRLRVWSESMKKPFEVKTKKTERNLDLKVGQVYKWEIFAVGQNRIQYEVTRPKFTFKLVGNRLKSPEIKEITDKTNIKDFGWNSVKYAQIYKAKLMRADILSDKWKSHIVSPDLKDIQWKLPENLPAGKYRLEVVADAETHIASTPASYEFLVKPVFKDLTGINEQGDLSLSSTDGTIITTPFN